MRIDFTSEIGTRTKGPVFVWMHGWGQTHKSMRALATQMKRQGHHIMIDLPGFGQTTALEQGADTAAYADHMMGLLTSRKIGIDQPVVLIGHSFGCRVAVQMASKYPSKIKAIIMMGGAGLQRKRSVAWKIRAFCLTSLGKLVRLSDRLFKTSFRDAYVSRFGSADYRNAGVLRETFVKVVQENLVAEARSVKCPTLLLYGSDDSETPPEIGKAYHKLISDSDYVELSGFGHLDILSRGSHQVEARIKYFIKQRGL